MNTTVVETPKAPGVPNMGIIPHATITMPASIEHQFSVSDINVFIARHEDAEDPAFSVAVVMLKDRRYAVIRRVGYCNVSMDLPDLIRFGLTEPERLSLGYEVSEDAFICDVMKITSMQTQMQPIG